MCAEDLFMPLELDERRAVDTANVRLYEACEQKPDLLGLKCRAAIDVRNILGRKLRRSGPEV